MHYKQIYIGINYQTPEKTVNWVDKLRNQVVDTLIIVVDNSYSDNPLLEKQLQDLKINNVLYLNTNDNLGYFNGASYALNYVQEKGDTFDWLIVSNVDIELESENIVDILNEYDKTDIGVVAPGIISVDGGYDKNPYKIQRCTKGHMYIRKIAFSNMLFANIYSGLVRLKNKLVVKALDGENKCQEGTEIYMPYGACIYFNKKYFEHGGKISIPLFLFGEELFVAETCKKLGLKIIYVPRIRFKNYEHASTSKLANKRIVKYNYKAICFIIKEFF
ncbi:MAG: glycosyltransferase [Lachnospiraceae bacterium]|nr:glycosyltransferase [Lachnospiraceae bacterium]